MGIWKLLLICGLFLLLPFGMSAQIYVSNEIEDRVFVSDWAFHIDHTGSLTLHDALNTPFNDSLESSLDELKKINPERKIWVKFDIVADSTLDRQVALRSSKFSHVRTYIISDSGTDSSDVGLADIGNLHLEDYDEAVVDLNLKAGQKITVVLAISHNHRSASLTNLYAEIFPSEAFIDNHIAHRPSKSYSSYFYVFFCGLLIFQLVYILLQWVLVRRIEYLYYVLYIASLLVYFYARFSVYFAESKTLAIIDAGLMIAINDILLILPSFFYFRFTRYFVELAETDPKLGRQFKIGEWILLAGIGVIFVMGIVPNDWSKILPIGVLLILQFLFAIYSLVRIARQRRTIARFLIAGSCMALMGHLIANFLPFMFSGEVPIAPISVAMVGLLLELVIFNTGLLFKAKEAETEKVKAQQAYIAELKNREKLKEEHRRSRDRISSDLHDDIGSTLSSISIYNYAAQQKLREGKSIEHLLLNISRSTTEAMNAMSDLVWSTNPSNDSNEKLVDRIRAFSFEILEACNCTFTTQVDPEFLEAQLNQIERKNILLILKEAANNTAKHAKASVCSLRITALNDGNFRIDYHDDGQGFGADVISGNGMRTMKKRANEIGGELEIKSSDEGTHIHLKLDPSRRRHISASNPN